MERTYWAQAKGKKVGPFATAQEAWTAFFTAYPKAKECSYGYGSEGAWFDIKWIRNAATRYSDYRDRYSR